MNLKSYLSLGAASVAVLASAGVANASVIGIGDGASFTLGLGNVGLFADDLVLDANDNQVVDGGDLFLPGNTSVINRVELGSANGTPTQFQLADPNTFAEGIVGFTEEITGLPVGNSVFIKSFDFNDVDKFQIVGTPDVSFDDGDPVSNTFNVLPSFGNFIEIEVPPEDGTPRDDLVIVLEQVTTNQPTALDADPEGSQLSPSVLGTGKLFTEAGRFLADISLSGTFSTTGTDPSDINPEDGSNNATGGNITVTVTSRPEPGTVPEPASLLGLFSVVGLAGLAKARSKK